MVRHRPGPRPLVALAFALSLPASLPAQSSRAAAIEGARVVVGDGEVLETANVIVRDGRIEAVAPGAPIPVDAEVVDGSGLTVMPGWIDACAFLGVTVPAPEDPPPGNASEEPDFSRQAYARTREANRNGIHPEFAARAVLDLPEADVRAWRGAGFTGVLAAPPVGYLRGRGCLVDLSGRPPRRAVVCEPDVLFASVARPERGSGYPGTVMALLAHVRQVLHDARHQRAWQERFARAPLETPAPPHDTALEALRPALEGQVRVAFHADSETEILRALDLAREFRLQPILVGAGEAFRVVERLKQDRVPLVVALDFPDEPTREGAKKKEAPAAAPAAQPEEPEVPGAGPQQEEPAVVGPAPEPEWEIEDPVRAEPLEVYQERLERWRERVANARTLLEAGLDVSFTARGHSQPKDFLADLRTAIAQGLDPAAAARCLTQAPAELCGVQHLLGTVEAGKLAHLVVVEGGLEDPQRAVRWIFVGGERFEGEKKKDKEPEGAAEEKTEGAPAAADLAGTWEVKGPEVEMTSTLVLVQDGTTLTGSLENPMGKWSLRGGTVDGNRFEIAVDVAFQNQTFEFRFEGTVEGDRMQGSLETPFGGPVEFEGSRKPGEVR